MDLSKVQAAYDENPISYLLFELIYDGATPVDFLLRYINQAGCELLCSTSNTLLGQSFFRLFPDADKSWLKLLHQVSQDEKPCSFHDYSILAKKYLHLDFFHQGSGLCGCFLSDVSNSAGGNRDSGHPDERPITHTEQLLADLMHQFAVSGRAIWLPAAPGDFTYQSDLETYALHIQVQPDSPPTSLLEDGYQNKRCYEVLHQRDTPCPSCPQPFLETNLLHSRQLYNQILNREYLHRSKLDTRDGRPVRSSIVHDITDPAQKKRLLAESLELLNLNNICSNLLLEDHPLAESLHNILAKLGAFFHAEAGFAVLCGGPNCQVAWAKNGPAPSVPSLFQSPTDAALREWGRILHDKAYVFIPDLSQIDCPQKDLDDLALQDIRSLHAVPIIIARQFRGVILLYNITGNLEQLPIIDMVGSLISHFVHRVELQLHNLLLKTFDPLTGHLNFDGFRQVAAKMIAENPGRKYSLWYCDIRRFKYINDVFGYDTGDRFLRYWANVISKDSRNGEIFCRVTADNMILLRWYDDPSELEARFEKMATALRSFPLFAGKRFASDMMCGIYLLSQEEAASLDISKILDRANIAQKSVKGFSGSHFAFYSGEMWQQQLREMELTQHVQSGIAAGEFYLCYQPQYHYRDGRIIGAEALVRWRHPTLGSVSPAEFIPILEKNGLINSLDLFVWEEVCKFLRGLLDLGSAYAIVPFSINISRLDIYLPNLDDILMGLIKKYRLEPSMLKLEITESAYIDNPDQLIKAVSNLRALGFSVEMDDFGSGYSSLNILKDVPVDVLKLDMNFLENEQNSERSGNILSSVVRMAHWIQMPVIAEGVETQEQADYLLGLGCSLMQGYFFARPMDGAELLSLLKEGAATPASAEQPPRPAPDMSEFLDSNGKASFLFHHCIGGAGILESDLSHVEAILLNGKFHTVLQLPHQRVEACRTSLQDLFLEADRPILLASLAEAAQKGNALCRLRTLSDPSSGTSRLIRVSSHHLSSRGQTHMVFVLVEDISDQSSINTPLFNASAEAASIVGQDNHTLRWQSAQYHIMTEVQSSVIFDYDCRADLMCIRINRKDGIPEEITIERFSTTTDFPHVHPDDHRLLLDHLAQATQAPTQSALEIRSSFFSQNFRWCRAKYVSLFHPCGEAYRIVGILEDIEDEALLRQRASRDAMTGLLNHDATKQLIGEALLHKEEGAMFVIDIDNFKQINDTLGHLYGDTVLQSVSAAIAKVFREEDIVGRIGGDEFLVFLRGQIDLPLVKQKAKQIFQALRSVEMPELGHVRASIGVALTEAGRSNPYDVLFKKADYSLYCAKTNGKNRYEIHSPEDQSPVHMPTAAPAAVTARDIPQKDVSYPTLVSDVFSLLFRAEKTHKGLQSALSHIGRWLEVSRIYIVERVQSGIYNTFEWCNDGISSEIKNMQAIRLSKDDGSEPYSDNFDYEGIFYCRDTSTLPNWQQEVLAPQGIQRMLQYAIRKDGAFAGFIGFDECTRHAFWSKGQVDTMTLIAKMISVFLENYRQISPPKL